MEEKAKLVISEKESLASELDNAQKGAQSRPKESMADSEDQSKEIDEVSALIYPYVGFSSENPNVLSSLESNRLITHVHYEAMNELVGISTWFQLTETLKLMRNQLTTEIEMKDKSASELENNLTSTKHALLDVQHQLTMAEKVRFGILQLNFP